MSFQIFKTRTGSMKGDVYPFWMVPTTRASCIVPKRWVFLCFLGTRVERMVFTQKEILKTTVRCNTIEVENGLTSMWFYWISKPTILKLWSKKEHLCQKPKYSSGFFSHKNLTKHEQYSNGDVCQYRIRSGDDFVPDSETQLESV